MRDTCATCGHPRAEHTGKSSRCAHVDELAPERPGDEAFDICMCTHFQEKDPL